MVDNCKLKDLFLIEKIGSMEPIYDCENFALVVKKNKTIKRIHGHRVQLDMLDEEHLTDDLLFSLINKAANMNRVFSACEIQTQYASIDLPIRWMLKPNNDVGLENIFGDEYYIINVMETSKIREVICDQLPEGEIIFLTDNEFCNRIAIDNNDNFGVCIFNTPSVLRCSYINSKQTH